MSRRTTKLLKTFLSTLHFSGADTLLAPYTRGLGAILKLDRVRPCQPGQSEPDQNLKLTPEFLERLIGQIRRQGFDIITLDEAHFRLVEGDGNHRPFVCLTFDHCYRDVLEYAYPILRRHGLPFAAYVTGDHADGRGGVWWLALEACIDRLSVLDLKMHGLPRRFRCATPADKERSYRDVYWWLRTLPELDARRTVAELCLQAQVDDVAVCRDAMMTWDEIRLLGSDPLVTLGAHTRRHFALAPLSLVEARAEMAESIGRLERETGRLCEHFSFPYGDAAACGPREFELARELNMKTAVTTQPRLIRLADRRSLTALPRIPIIGSYQRSRYVKVLLNGAPLAYSGLHSDPASVS